MSEVSNILNQFMQQLAGELKSNVGSGEVADSIEVKTTEIKEGVFVGATSYLLASVAVPALETGRAPTGKGIPGKKFTSNGTLQKMLLAWIERKNIIPRPKQGKTKMRQALTQEQLSWAMAIKIHKEGTKLYADSPVGYKKSGVVSNVINDQRIDALLGAFSSKSGRLLLNQVVKNIKG